ncbi:S1 RNA-binding domain-containing protein [Streptomyces cadmiisoli]|uniref:S1 RNA-binding domain-containing protein n=1 Tax=Streptomyces cadmiisoli TaxID=2184053 RepID=UPI00319E0503
MCRSPTTSRDWSIVKSSRGRLSRLQKRAVVQVGDEITVVVTEIDRERRRLSLSRRQASTALD